MPFADAADFYHATDFAQIVDDPLEVCGAADHDLKEVERPVVGQGADIGALDIDLDRTDGLAHGGQQAGPVFRQDFDFDRAGEVVGLVPADRDVALRVAFQQALTLHRMHGHAFAPGDDAQNPLSGQGIAAAPEAHQDIADAPDPYPAPPAVFAVRSADNLVEFGLVQGLPRLAAVGRQQMGQQISDGQLAVAQGGQQGFFALIAQGL